ncbi:MAG TPA: M48 family peptidase, partial [Spirochaetia bacterium]|nr:M48 family peptidase [Spirochaetia bacterium]
MCPAGLTGRFPHEYVYGVRKGNGMIDQTVMGIVIGILLLRFVLETGLLVLNIRHVRRREGTVPDAVRDRIEAATAERAARYTLSKNRFSLIVLLFSTAFAAALLFFQVFGQLEKAVALLGLPGYLDKLVFLAASGFLFFLFFLPFSLYAQFGLETRYGFNTMTPGVFLGDLIKSLSVNVVIGVPLILGIFVLVDAAGAWWWVLAWGLFVLAQLVLSFLYPAVIAPLFNKFTPLQEGSLKERLRELFAAEGLTLKGIYIMDGSRRSRHGNAYFTGFGKVKRIVLFDTLVSSLSEDELVAVTAHELGHERKGHVWKGMAAGVLVSAAGFFLLSLLLQFPPLFTAFGLAGPSVAGLFVIARVAGGPLFFLFRPVVAAFSRRREYQADRFAVRALGGNSTPMETALVGLSRENLA